MKPAPWYRPTKQLLSLCLGALLFLLTPALADASQWTLTPVDNTATDTGKFASLALDANKFLHISYFDAAGNLKYATNKTGLWVPSAVATGSVTAAGTAIAIDASNNNPQIAYYFSGGNGVRDISYNAGTWTPADINNSAFTPTADKAVAIANRGGYSYVTFFRSGLYFAMNSTQSGYGSWTAPVAVDAGNTSMGTFSAIAVDSTGVAHAVYYNAATSGGNKQKLLYRKRTAGVSGVWDAAAIPVVSGAAGNADIGRYCAIAVGMVGTTETLFVTYLDYKTNNIMFTTMPASGGSWTTPASIGAAGSTTSFIGGYTSIAVDSSGAAHVSFYYNNAGTANLKYATNLGGTWNVETVDTATAGTYSSIAVDAHQTVSIAYYDVTNTALKVATRSAILVSNAAWDFGPVDPGSQSVTKTFTVTNNQLVGQTFAAATLTGTDAGQFAISSDGCDGYLITPQATCTVSAYFAPASGTPLTRSATLTVSSSSPSVASRAVPLSGAATDKLIIHASAGTGGSISPSGTFTVARGASQTFAVTPLSGYGISGVTDNGIPMSAPYTLTNIAVDHTVVASFTSLSLPFLILNTLTAYGTLQGACDAASDNNIIESWVGPFPTESLTVVRNITTTVKGGYNSDFSSQTGSTTLHSILVSIPNTNPGKLIVEKVVLK